ncbi:hypothetical protein Mal52_13770 [Symmachiella dynata]|uniref:Uncharacterized protein n=1 Tax=Symmachiella dynata TaxID=2527995 RepID=A0A517ZKB0_9PLAN|nr:hypothetical protein [Symmachiella dynata]QDU42908.1 hypothetical protein Mal52_13770 [Symmachiella dynata]
MELIIASAVLLAAAGYGIYRNYSRLRRNRRQRRWQHEQRRRQQVREAAARRRAAAEKLRRLNAIARNLQLALMQINNARDFQRAASWAAKAQGLPAGFHQRQFRRFRSRLRDHALNRIVAGENPEQVHDSLQSLVRNLGIAEFEADYLMAEVLDRQPQRRDANGAFENQLRQSHDEHRRRMEVLHNMEGLDEDIREQLLEAELGRFRSRLFGEV